jgi:hypothetical protein
VETKKNKRFILDIFDPSYGAVKIDLAFKIGSIVSFTNNIPQALGFSCK